MPPWRLGPLAPAMLGAPSDHTEMSKISRPVECTKSTRWMPCVSMSQYLMYSCTSSLSVPQVFGRFMTTNSARFDLVWMIWPNFAQVSASKTCLRVPDGDIARVHPGIVGQLFVDTTGRGASGSPAAPPNTSGQDLCTAGAFSQGGNVAVDCVVAVAAPSEPLSPGAPAEQDPGRGDASARRPGMRAAAPRRSCTRRRPLPPSRQSLTTTLASGTSLPSTEGRPWPLGGAVGAAKRSSISKGIGSRLRPPRGANCCK
mmetsp:Transcript_62790/g.180619  ORF Transcript_62790/g.180619 Transcript_62790/m.180619 type:complete len:257 (+) Transcript_62790:37-807(+)